MAVAAAIAIKWNEILDRCVYTLKGTLGMGVYEF